jgi:hypothetical protein
VWNEPRLNTVVVPNIHTALRIDMFYMFVGLVILSSALGHRYDAITGCLALGAGVMVLGALNEMINYLRDRNTYDNPEDSE